MSESRRVEPRQLTPRASLSPRHYIRFTQASPVAGKVLYGSLWIAGSASISGPRGVARAKPLET